MKRKIISAVISASLAAGSLPSVMLSASAASDATLTLGAEVFRESFEQSEDEIKEQMYSGEYGWTITDEIKDDGSRTGKIDAGTWLNTGSTAIRFISNAWAGTNHAELDFAAAAEVKGLDTSALSATLADNPAIGFTFGYQADYSNSFGNLIDGSRNIVALLNADGTPFMALEAYVKDKSSDDITLNLIAPSADGTENVRYEIASGKTNVIKTDVSGNSDETSVIRKAVVYVNSAESTYKLTLDGEAVTVNGSEWIPAATSYDVGTSAKATSLVPSGLVLSNIDSSWFGGPLLDDVYVSSYSTLYYSGEAAAPDKAMSMWYRSPASEWAESLPLGNGRIGAMIWGGVVSDTVSLSEVTNWSGEDQTDLDHDGSVDNWAALNELREELKKESPDRTAISELIQEMGGESNPTFGTNRAFGKLVFGFDGIDAEISDYRRSLDLEDAVSSVEFTAGGTAYTREAFVSNPDQVMALKYTADKSGKISFDVNFALEDTKGGTGSVTAGDGYIEWDGAVYNDSSVQNGVNTFGYMSADTTGGTVTYDSTGIHISGADEAVIYVSIGTDFTAGENYEQNSKENCKAQLDAAAAKGYASLKSDHVADVNALFNRMTVEIGAAEDLKSELPTDERLQAIRDGGEVDGSFASLWYQYARYLMIAGSRENSPMPMNLLGIWNDNVAANMAWNADYHLDINTQMNQWMANSANLSEGEIPIFNFMKNILIPNGQITAALQYGAEGWLAPVATNAWGYTGISSSSWESFTGTTCGAWLAQEIMSYYDYTGDVEFLETDGFDMLVETAKFYNSFMTEYQDGDNTYWVTIPSGSPEHGYLEMMSTMDITVISDIFTQVLRCYDILGYEHDEFYEEVCEKLNNMPPYTIDESGSLDEWPYTTIESNAGNTDHRHTSHLLGLFPYAQITPEETPELARAALISMQRRYDRSDFEHTEWTAVNAQGQYARLKDGQNAYKYLKLEADTFTWPNLLSISPEGIALAPTDVYCIDGTLGSAEGISEMLLQSHNDRLEFLPALPQQWDEGNIEGMGASGAFTVDFAWEDYTIKSAKIVSKSGNTARIVRNGYINWENMGVYKLESDGSYTSVATTMDDDTIAFETEAGGVYVLKSKTDPEKNIQTGRIINDSDPRITYSNFGYNAGRTRTDYMDDVHYGEQANNSTAEFTFRGTGIDVITESGTDGKAFDVYIDGEKQSGSYTSYTDTNIDQNVAFSVRNLEYGDHTIKIVQTEDGGYICLDAFAVHGQYFSYMNDDNAAISYSDGWVNADGRLAGGNTNYMDDVHYADSADKSVTVSFTGTGIEILAERGGANGNIEIEIDGTNMGTVSASSDGSQYNNCVWEINGLSNSDHTLTITNTGSGGWGWLVLDGFVVLNDGGTSFNTGTYKMTDLASSGVLDVSDGVLAEQTGASLASYQKWIISKVDENRFRIISAYNGRAVTMENGSAVMRDLDEDNASQIFTAMAHGTLSDVVLLTDGYGSYLQTNGGTDYYNSGSIGLWYSDWINDSSAHFLWYIEDIGNGLSVIKSYLGSDDEKGYFSIYPSSINDDGAAVWSVTEQTDDGAVWNIEQAASGEYTITSARNGMQIVDSNGAATLAAAGSDNNTWTIDTAKQDGTTYYVFTNVTTGNELVFGGNSKWSLVKSESSGSVSYVYDVDIAGTVTNGNTLNVSYSFGSLGASETQSVWSAYVVGSKSEALTSPIAEGAATAATGFDFTLSGYDSEKTIAVEITPYTSDGAGVRTIEYIEPVASSPSFDVMVATVEDFANGMPNGWYDGGGSYTLSAAGGELTMLSTSWWDSSYAGVNFADSSKYDNIPSDNLYIEFDAKFAPPSNNDNNSVAYAAIKNGSCKFAAVRLSGNNLELVALSSEGGARRAYLISSNTSETWNTSINFKFYFDEANNRFAVKVDDEYVRDDSGDIWFYPTADDANDIGASSIGTVSGITGVEIGHLRSAYNSTMYFDNLTIGSYVESESSGWVIDEVSAPEGIVAGEQCAIDLSIHEESECFDGMAYVAVYNGGMPVALKVIPHEDIVFSDRGTFDTSVAVNIPEIGGETVIKAFVWNADMQPIGAAREVTYDVASTLDVPNVFSDNMMLQADAPVNVWGNADAGDVITVKLSGEGITETATATADESGEWMATIEREFECGGDYTLTVSRGMETRVFDNIIFGDVYVLAGQSNMEYWMSWGSSDAYAYLTSSDGIAEMTTTEIRTINMNSRGDGPDTPSNDLSEGDLGELVWQEMSPDTGWTNSAIGYFFARDILKSTGRPVGFISTAVGGTGIKRWVARDDGTDRWVSDLYNGRIYPLRNFAISGVLWYQGEADGDPNYDCMDEEEYSDVFAELIDDYRALFGRDDLPFMFAQLARYEGEGDYGKVRDFKELRSAQYYTLSKVSNPENVFIISNLDAVGNYGSSSDTTGTARVDIHPSGKIEVANRFARQALANIYGMTDVIACGPMYRSMEIDGDKIILTFDCTGDLAIMPLDDYDDYLTQSAIDAGEFDPDELNGFEIAGSNGEYTTAKAVIDGNTVILTADGVTEPKNARYTYEAFPESPNLTDESGLPSYTFSTEYSNR